MCLLLWTSPPSVLNLFVPSFWKPFVHTTYSCPVVGSCCDVMLNITSEHVKVELQLLQNRGKEQKEHHDELDVFFLFYIRNALKSYSCGGTVHAANIWLREKSQIEAFVNWIITVFAWWPGPATNGPSNTLHSPELWCLFLTLVVVGWLCGYQNFFFKGDSNPKLMYTTYCTYRALFQWHFYNQPGFSNKITLKSKKKVQFRNGGWQYHMVLNFETTI